MKTAQLKYYFIIIQVIMLGACAPQSTPIIPDTSSSSTQPPADSPSAVPIDLAGPVMEVGSSFLYVDGTVLVPVPGGPFTMGSGGPDNPEHEVNVSDFWIYSTKVTNGQYAYCVASGLCTPPLKADNPGYDDRLHSNDPMVGVDYDQAAAYCTFVHARLPTEAEWEKTARGPDGNIYPWGDGSPSCDLLNYVNCIGKTTPVNTYPSGRSYYQAFDMAGNVLEWVADWYQVDYYANSPTDNPTGPDKTQHRSIRSSAFNSGSDQLPASTRSHANPGIHRDNLGFRCVVEDPTYFAPSCETPAIYGTDSIGGANSGPQPEVVCPTLEITQNSFCQGTTPITNVTFSPPGAEVIPSSCVPNPSGNGGYQCTENGSVAVCSTCTVTVKSPPLCPSGTQYSDTSKTCVRITGGTGACLPGFSLTSLETFNSVRRLTTTSESNAASTVTPGQCCAYTPQTSDVPLPNQTCLRRIGSQNTVCYDTPPVCPPGTTYDGLQCISTQTQSFCKVEGIALNSCTGGGDDGGTSGCTNSCPSGYALNPTTCKCDCTTC